jgi:hypothetical protein
MKDSQEERFSTTYTDGTIIIKEGKGGGYASYPWALHDYERALDISVKESWLISRMVKHSWEKRRIVNISMSKVCRKSIISRPTLTKLINSLLNKGYIDIVGWEEPGDNRAIYDVSGVYAALTIAIMCDPFSDYTEENGKHWISDFFENSPYEWSGFSTPKQLNDHLLEQGKRMNWCIGLIEPCRLRGEKNQKKWNYVEKEYKH